MNTDKRNCNDLSEVIIGRAFAGHLWCQTRLVSGSLILYENALAHELRKIGLSVRQQYNIQVWYDGIIAGVYTADMLVEDSVLIELKATKALDPGH